MSLNILHVIYIPENVTLVCGNLHWKANGKCVLCLINNAEYEVQMAKDDQETTGGQSSQALCQMDVINYTVTI